MWRTHTHIQQYFSLEVIYDIVMKFKLTILSIRCFYPSKSGHPLSLLILHPIIEKYLVPGTNYVVTNCCETAVILQNQCIYSIIFEFRCIPSFPIIAAFSRPSPAHPNPDLLVLAVVVLSHPRDAQPLLSPRCTYYALRCGDAAPLPGKARKTKGKKKGKRETS